MCVCVKLRSTDNTDSECILYWILTSYQHQTSRDCVPPDRNCQ